MPLFVDEVQTPRQQNNNFRNFNREKYLELLQDVIHPAITNVIENNGLDERVLLNDPLNHQMFHH